VQLPRGRAGKRAKQPRPGGARPGPGVDPLKAVTGETKLAGRLAGAPHFLAEGIVLGFSHAASPETHFVTMSPAPGSSAEPTSPVRCDS
jgi:hypothetical protein